MNDYSNAFARANAFDAQVAADAKKISADYADIVALSIRQGFGAIEITVARKQDGSFDTSNAMTFMKGEHLLPWHEAWPNLSFQKSQAVGYTLLNLLVLISSQPLTYVPDTRT